MSIIRTAGVKILKHTVKEIIINEHHKLFLSGIRTVLSLGLMDSEEILKIYLYKFINI